MGCEQVSTYEPNNDITTKPKDNKYEEPDLILDYEEEDNLCYQESNLLWVDANMNTEENKFYQNMIKKIKPITLFTFKLILMIVLINYLRKN